MYEDCMRATRIFQDIASESSGINQPTTSNIYNILTAVTCKFNNIINRQFAVQQAPAKYN